MYVAHDMNDVAHVHIIAGSSLCECECMLAFTVHDFFAIMDEKDSKPSESQYEVKNAEVAPPPYTELPQGATAANLILSRAIHLASRTLLSHTLLHSSSKATLVR